MFDPIIHVLSSLDSFGMRNPGRIIFALIAIAALAVLMWRTYVRFSDPEQKRAFERSVRIRRVFIFISRVVIILLVGMVFTNPFVSFPDMIASEPKAVILVDQTSSMSNADTQGLDELIAQVESRIATQVYPLERSSWDAVRPHIEEGTPILLASDGMLSGDGLAIARYARALNSSINIIDLPNLRPDVGVSIDAPALTAARVETPISVRVESNELGRDLEYRLIVELDDEVVRNVSASGPNTFELSLLPSEGEKLVVARLEVDDAFDENNIAARSMLVADRPQVHLVTRDQSSPLARYLGELYTLSTSSSIPSDLSDISALVIDNYDASALDARYEDLSDFVLNGGGLVVLGGDRSYDRGDYRGSRIETLLPVISEKGVPEDDGTLSVVLVLDISASTGQVVRDGSLVTIVDIIKSGSISVYDALKESDYAGVLVFNTEPRIIQEFSMKSDQSGVQTRIASLVFTGGTFIHTGMGAAATMLAQSPGTRYVILFSDGESQTMRRDRETAIALRNLGVTMHAVSIGDGSDRDHLFDLARITGGTLFEPEETDKFEILFGTHDEPPPPDAPIIAGLVPWDTNHFVSSGLSLSSSVYGFNDVVPKRSAQQLVVTQSNNPIVASSYFGLGRVVSIATDSGREWSGEVFERDGMLFARSVNFALGDASRQQDFFVRADDPRADEPFRIVVFSQSHVPSIDVDDRSVPLMQIDEGEYRGELELGQGVYDIGPRSLVVNYPREYVYPRTSMRQVAFASEGALFSVAEADRIEAFALENSFESSNRLRPIPEYFLLFAAIIFLIEVIIRRLTERRRA